MQQCGKHGQVYSYPVGNFYIEEENDQITMIHFLGKEEADCGRERKFCKELMKEKVREDGGSSILREAARQLGEYLEGRRQTFELPLNPQGTSFQKKVWQALRDIPYGETRTYGQIAKEVGSPKGARAVGMACHNNPIIIVTPCHRVVGANGALTGFACGLEMKEFLLKLEYVL